MPLGGELLQARVIAKLLHDAGFHDEKLLTAIAICYAESSGYTEAYNSDNPDGSTDYGLMQINSVHIGQTVEGTEVTVETLYYPAFNCVVAYHIYRGDEYSFNPWVAFTSGAYTANLGKAIKAVANMWRERYGLRLR